MVETGGTSRLNIKPIDQCPMKFRFNVKDVERTPEARRSKGMTIEIRRLEWGTTAEFADPDGNRCALRSDQGFCA